MKTLKKIDDFLHNIRTHKFLLVISLIPLVIGVVLYYDYNLGKPKVLKESSGILIGYDPSHDYEISNVQFVMELVPHKNKIYLEIYFTHYVGGNFTLMMSLPYRINTLDPHLPIDIGKWFFKNATSGSVLIVELYDVVKPSDGYDSKKVSCTIKLHDKIAQPNFGYYRIMIPFGGSFTKDVQEQWDNYANRVGTKGNGATGQIRIIIQSNSVIEGNSHEITRRDPVNDYQQLEFQINDFTPFFFQYQIPGKVNKYSLELFWAGIFFGASLSIIIETLLHLHNHDIYEIDEDNNDKVKVSKNKIKKINENESTISIELIKPADKLFEWVVILLTIFQATLFQFVTWLFKSDNFDNVSKVTEIMMKFTYPYIIFIVSWMIALNIEENNIIKALKWRIISIGVITLLILYNFHALNNIIFPDIFYTKGLLKVIFNACIFLLTLSSIGIPVLIFKKYLSLSKESIYWNKKNTSYYHFLMGLLIPFFILLIFESLIRYIWNT